MPRGDKSKYTEKQKRQADHIARGYQERGHRSPKPKNVPGQRSIKSVVAEKNKGDRGEKQL